ncbi:MAG: histidine kinase [Flavobacteriaceae bacterium]
MKLRIREHEIVLATLITLFGVLLYLIQSFKLSTTDVQLIYATPFESYGNSFNYYLNILLPQLTQVLFPFLCYLIIYWKITPLVSSIYSTSSKGSKRSKALVIFALLILIGVLLIIVGKVTIYYASPRSVADGVLRLMAISNEKLIARHLLFTSFDMRDISMFFLYVIYLIYFGCREIFIYTLSRVGARKPYIILVSNQAMTFLFAFILIVFFTSIFGVIQNVAVYLVMILSVFILYMINTYWLFPSKGASSFISFKVIGGILLSTIIAMAPLALAARNIGLKPANFFNSWLLLSLIITPITWVLYEQRKDKILQLRGVQKVLEKSKADLQFLKSQINPHFLFNALNTLYGTALKEKSESTAEGIQKLGDMMRFMLHENNQDEISLGKEIEYLKNYLSLQKLRTCASPGIVIEEHIDQQCSDQQIAPMLLIPFVENAFKHGISLQKKSWITIKLQCSENRILFEVRNSIHINRENDPEKEKSGIGLQNVQERLKLLYEGKHELTFGAWGNEFNAKLSIQI